MRRVGYDGYFIAAHSDKKCSCPTLELGWQFASRLCSRSARTLSAAYAPPPRFTCGIWLATGPRGAERSEAKFVTLALCPPCGRTKLNECGANVTVFRSARTTVWGGAPEPEHDQFCSATPGALNRGSVLATLLHCVPRRKGCRFSAGSQARSEALNRGDYRSRTLIVVLLVECFTPGEEKYPVVANALRCI